MHEQPQRIVRKDATFFRAPHEMLSTMAVAIRWSETGEHGDGRIIPATTSRRSAPLIISSPPFRLPRHRRPSWHDLVTRHPLQFSSLYLSCCSICFLARTRLVVMKTCTATCHFYYDSYGSKAAIQHKHKPFTKWETTTCFLVDCNGCTEQNSTTSEPFNVLQIRQKKDDSLEQPFAKLTVKHGLGINTDIINSTSSSSQVVRYTVPTGLTKRKQYAIT